MALDGEPGRYVTGNLLTNIAFVHGSMESVLRHAGTSLAGFRVLSCIERLDEGASVGDVARALRLSTPRVTEVVDCLVDCDLCRRTRGEDDRRRVRLEVTVGGSRAVGESDAALSSLLRRLWAPLGRDHVLNNARGNLMIDNAFKKGLSRTGMRFSQVYVEVFAVCMQIAEQACRDGGLTLPTLRVLLALAEADAPLPMAALADVLLMGQSSLSLAVERLYRKGLAQRREREEDRRSFEISPTSEGISALGRAMPVVERGLTCGTYATSLDEQRLFLEEADIIVSVERARRRSVAQSARTFD